MAEPTKIDIKKLNVVRATITGERPEVLFGMAYHVLQENGNILFIKYEQSGEKYKLIIYSEVSEE